MNRIQFDENERTRDVFEQIGSYAKPPLMPLPDFNDSATYLDEGIKPGAISRFVIKIAMSFSGFKSFYRQLSNHLEVLLRQHNLRLPGLFSPIISATLVLDHDRRDLSPIQRAAILLMGARKLYDDLIGGRLEPDQYKEQALEMGQYPNLFSTSLVLDGKGARVFKSKLVSKILVLVGGKFYLLDVGNLDTETTIEQVEEALAQLVAQSHKNKLRPDEFSPGIITCAANRTQLRAFHDLLKDERNRSSYQALRHTFVTLCLDLDAYPASDDEVMLVGHSQNYENRWFHSSLQLVVFGNAKACAICNFTTYLDGNTMMRGAAELQKRATTYPLGIKKNNEPVRPILTKELTWNINPVVIRRAERDLKFISDTQQATFEITGMGKKFFNAHGIDPVPTFIIALQMTANQLMDKKVVIEQFLTLSKYRCMDLTTAIVTTDEVLKFIDYINSYRIDPAYARTLLQEAINSQSRECRKGRRYLPVSVLLILFFRSRKLLSKFYALAITGILLTILRVLGFYKSRPAREVIVSHPEIYPEVPLVGRPGIRLPYAKYFGLHYQIFENKIIITMMPGIKWKISNVELIAKLRKNLSRIKLAIENSQN